MKNKPGMANKKAIFITGFNNWGKSTIIENLFNRRYYYYNRTYPLHEVEIEIEFTVETHSNDDYIGERWLELIENRINNSPNNGQHLFTALCPSMERDNNFVNLLNSQLLREYKKYIFLIEYKWDLHPKLITKNIIRLNDDIDNAQFFVINSRMMPGKINQLISQFNNNFVD